MKTNLHWALAEIRLIHQTKRLAGTTVLRYFTGVSLSPRREPCRLIRTKHWVHVVSVVDATLELELGGGDYPKTDSLRRLSAMAGGDYPKVDSSQRFGASKDII